MAFSNDLGGDQYAELTAIGALWGLDQWRVSSFSYSIDSVDEALALNSDGRVVAWRQIFSDRPGSGFVQCWSLVDMPPDADELIAMTEYGGYQAYRETYSIPCLRRKTARSAGQEAMARLESPDVHNLYSRYKNRSRASNAQADKTADGTGDPEPQNRWQDRRTAGHADRLYCTHGATAGSAL